MADTQSAPGPQDRSIQGAPDVVDISALLSAFWDGKWLILVSALVGLIYGLRLLTNYQPTYEAQMVVMPIQQQGGSGGSVGSGLQSLGISLGVRQVSNFDRLQLVFESNEFAELLDRKHDLLRKVFADQWDSQTQSWRRPTGERFRNDQDLRGRLRRNVWLEPNLNGLSRYLKSSVKFRLVDQGQFHRMSFAHSDRDFAIWLLATVYFEAEELVRRQDAAENAQRRQYLEEQLRRSSVIEVRQSLAQLITGEERQAMLMQGTLPYVGRVALASRADEQPVEPDFVLVVVTPVLASVGATALVIILLVLASTELFGKRGRSQSAASTR